MEYEFVTSNNGELYHWGIKGMKWGIRRYQNKDGSLTPAGQKRRAKLESELKTLKGKKTAGSSSTKRAQAAKAKPAVREAPKKKTVAEMTDEELRDKTNRMQLESNYYNAAKNLAAANPRQVSKGEKFVNSLVNDVVAPAAKNAGKAFLEKKMKDMLGIKDTKPLSYDDQLKKFDLESKKKNQKYDDMDRELKEIKKQWELEEEKLRQKRERDKRNEKKD